MFGLNMMKNKTSLNIINGNSIAKQVNIFDCNIVFSLIGKLFVMLIVFPSKDILDDDIEVIAPTNKMKK